MEKKVLAYLELGALVNFALDCYHITIEEAGLHHAEIARDIVTLIRQDEREKQELRLNPDYLDFKKGVWEGRQLERAKIIEWLDGDCEHYPPNPKAKLMCFRKAMPRKECPECLRALKATVGK